MAAAPLVLLHPLGSDRSFWRPVAQHLDAIAHLAVDLPGHGDAAAGAASIAAMSDVVAAELKAANIDRYRLCGVSLGGLIALDMASRFTDEVAGVVLADTVATYPPPFASMWQQRARLATERGMAALVDATMSTWFTSAFLAAGGGAVRRARETFLATPVDGYVQACQALATADWTDQVALINAPTLILCGTEDMPPFVAAATFFATQIRGAQLTWISGAHAVALEKPAEFAGAIKDFFRS